MKSFEILSFAILSLLASFSGYAVGADIWDMSAYRACLQSHLESLPGHSSSDYVLPPPHEGLTFEGFSLSVEFCSKLLVEYNKAISSNTEISDYCVAWTDIPVGIPASVVIVSDNEILSNCKSGMTIVDVDQLDPKIENWINSSDELSLEVKQQLLYNITNWKIENVKMAKESRIRSVKNLARRHGIKTIEWYVKYFSEPNQLKIRKYNVSD